MSFPRKRESRSFLCDYSTLLDSCLRRNDSEVCFFIRKRLLSNTLIIALLFLFFTSFANNATASQEEIPLQAAAQSSTDKDSDSLSSQLVWGFADNLFENKDYYRAITEYKRFIFLFPDNPLTLNAKYKIGLSYFNGEKYQDAAASFRDISTLTEKNKLTKDALLKLAETYFKAKQYQDAIDTYDEFVNNYPTEQESQDIKYKIGRTYFFDKKYLDAKKSFEAVPAESQYFAVSSTISNELDQFNTLPYRSPGLAGGLSAVLPGAGQAYCGRYPDAVMSFILNGAFIWGTIEQFNHHNNVTGGVLAFFSLTWYSGNVYGAISSAEKFNRDAENNLLKTIENKYNLSLKYDYETQTNYLVFNMKW